MRDELVITRSNLGQLASFVGVGALLMGGLGWLWAGWLSSYVQIALVIGIVGVALWVVLTPREFIDFVSGRRARQGTVAVFSVLLFVGIVGMFYIFVERAVITLDMTEAGDFTLSAESRRVLASLDRDIRITGFYSPARVATRELDDQFFRQYEIESNGRITREYIDPVRQPAIATAFRAQDGDVFISFVNPDGTVDMNSVSYVPMIDRQERDMTLAISRLLATGTFSVYFDLSLVELDPGDMSSRGISIFTQLLQANGFNTQPLDLAQLAATNDQIPMDASAVIIARPQTEITPAMVRVLDDYLRRGGGLFLAADYPVTAIAEDSPFNDYLWNDWGMRVLDTVVVEEIATGPTPLDVVSAIIYDSDISASIDPEFDLDSRTQFRITRSIAIDDDPPVFNGSVIMSSPDSFGETDLDTLARTNDFGYDDGADIPGPLTLVAFGSNPATGGRVVAVGDSDFLTDGQLGSPSGNAYLSMNIIGWLTEYTQSVSFAPTAGVGNVPFIFVDTATLDRIVFGTLIVLPGVTLLLGLGVWFVRRRR
ncbi:MAG: DUF4350 domain-containing protein [Phototrophicaceae bacterium]